MNLRLLPRRLPILALILVLAWAWLAVAGGVAQAAGSGLHEATVPVPDRDRPARQAGFEAALDRVLLKLSGDRQVLADPRLADIRAAASRYVQRFRYVDLGENQPGLEVLFDVAALERQLAERGLPVWGADRPSVLLWLATVDEGRRVVLGGEEGRPLQQILTGVARDRGLRLVFPVMDLQDQAAVSYADLAGGFHEPVLQASGRYASRFVLAAHVQRRGGLWSGRWRLMGQEQQEDFTVEADTLEAALDEGLQRVADALGRRLAIAGLLASEDHVLVTVDGVNSLAEFQAVRQYLAELSVVAEIRPHRLEAGQAVFITRLRGSPRDLERGVRLGRVLAPAETAADLPFHEQHMSSVSLRLSR
ncbi:DUF2066 domain-containing protein [Thioalkalivibrio sulfidiphilus]|uniref:DUF2066 domain-containing protein n=1 Tax=Thioalkalivibrio sulfidiphilus TaxID=1033854 RepID=UPI0005719A33|nr:DUF2066 domain-containing protein [Thioalkalivibrio sulfidiphilus]